MRAISTTVFFCEALSKQLLGHVYFLGAETSASGTVYPILVDSSDLTLSHRSRNPTAYGSQEMDGYTIT